MTISFNLMPSDTRVPGQYAEFDSSQAVQGLPKQPNRLLFMGQMLAGGHATALTPVRVTSVSQAKDLFGRGSMLARMYEAAFAVGGNTETWAVPQLDVAGGVAATGSIVVSGAQTSAGSIYLYVAAVRIEIPVAVGDSLTVIAAAIAAAINALPDLPVTATSNVATVTITARHKGVCGNDIDLRTNYYAGEKGPTGLVVTITATANGATNPSLSAVFTAIGDDWFNYFAVPYTDASNMAAVHTELASRFGPLRAIDGMAFTMVRGQLASLLTFGSGYNSQHISALAMKGGPTGPCEMAAVYAMTIARFGSSDPARPFQTLELVGVLPPLPASRFTQYERDQLLHDGMSTVTYDRGGTVRLERPITMYQTDAYGFADVAYLDVNTQLTLSYLRYSLRARIAQKFPRHKLASDDTSFGRRQAVVTPKILQAELIALATEWERDGLVEHINKFKKQIVVERDPNDVNRVNALLPPDTVNGLRVFAGLIQFRL